MKICPVILSGGAGTRLWPLSRKLLPKQFLNLSSNESLLVETANRVNDSDLDAIPPIIVCSQDHQFLVSNLLDEAKTEYLSIILEPVGKNTAPAATLAAIYLKELYPQEDLCILVMPADHKIDDNKGFIESVKSSIKEASNSLCIFGIEPSSPSTSYGYIEILRSSGAGLLDVLNFHEKPEEKIAKKYISTGNYYWNSGIFLFSVSHFLSSIKKTDNIIFETCQDSIKNFRFRSERVVKIALGGGIKLMSILVLIKS